MPPRVHRGLYARPLTLLFVRSKLASNLAPMAPRVVDKGNFRSRIKRPKRSIRIHRQPKSPVPARQNRRRVGLLLNQLQPAGYERPDFNLPNGKSAPVVHHHIDDATGSRFALDCVNKIRLIAHTILASPAKEEVRHRERSDRSYSGDGSRQDRPPRRIACRE